MVNRTDVLTDAVHLRDLRVPSEDGGWLVVPAFSSLIEVARANAMNLAGCPMKIGEITRPQLAVQARAELIQAAVEWTRQYRNVSVSFEQENGGLPAVYVTGHQPELFHPGVWFKNAILHHAAALGQAVAIHLIIDNDTMKSASVRVLGGDCDRPRMINVPIDDGPSGIPYEDRRIHDADVFRNFGKRVKDSLGGMILDPVVDQFWPLVELRARENPRLGHAIAQARHLWEKRWGWNTLEVPQSVVCEQPSFLRLVWHLWVHRERFREIHNHAVQAYRRVHRLRSRSHPFPELLQVDDWCETPFWTWTVDEPVRRKVFVREVNGGLEITDGIAWKDEVPRGASGFGTLLGWWRDQGNKGRRIRSRAVVTTLWARMCLSDLFIHGLGGAKYDQVTDEIIRQFFQCEPPVYCTATATVRLPVSAGRVTIYDVKCLRQLLRELEFHPERFIPYHRLSSLQRETAERLIEEKWKWIRQEVTWENARNRFLAIRAFNRALQEFLVGERKELERRLQATIQQLEATQVLSSRDWPFCIYSVTQLDQFFDAVAQSCMAR